MSPAIQAHNPGEQGNILYYILIAVILLAALSLAVSRGGRGSIGALTSDQQKLLATEIIDYGDTLAKATTQLRLRGVRFDQLRFAATGLNAAYGVPGASPGNEIFNAEGGAVNYKAPPENAMTSPGDYIFTAANAVAGVGTTCAAADCSDLIVLAGPLKTEVCNEINVLLGLDTSLPTLSSIDKTTFFAGSSTYSATIGGTASDVALKEKTAGCFDAGGLNYFYQVLLPQ